MKSVVVKLNPFAGVTLTRPLSTPPATYYTVQIVNPLEIHRCSPLTSQYPLRTNSPPKKLSFSASASNGNNSNGGNDNNKDSLRTEAGGIEENGLKKNNGDPVDGNGDPVDGNGDGGGNGGNRRSRLNLKWVDLLLDPDPDNVLAVGLTGVLAWASVQVLWQLFVISIAILLAALKYSFVAALLIFILITLL